MFLKQSAQFHMAEELLEIIFATQYHVLQVCLKLYSLSLPCNFWIYLSVHVTLLFCYNLIQVLPSNIKN